MAGFLEKLQSADEATKRKLLVAGTIVAMIVVVFVWLKYFNNLIGQANVGVEVAAGEGSFSFFETMKNGATFIYEGAAERLRDLGDVLKAPRSYIVTPPTK